MDKKSAYLRLLTGPHKGGVFVLKALSVFEIGRGEGCQVRLEDPSVCTNHARIYRKGDLWTFYDLNSDGGSSINDIKIHKRGLDGGEIIRIGPYEMHFSFEAPGSKSEGEDAGGDQQQVEQHVEPEVEPLAEVAEKDRPSSVHQTPFLKIEDATGDQDVPEDQTVVHQGGLERQDDAGEASEPELEERRITPYPKGGVTHRESGPPPGAEDVCLRVIDGDERDIGKELLLDPTRDYIMGRSETCSLVLNDGKVSRLHCRIECSGGHFQITDLNSANGTILNGERVLDASLRLGDYIRLGFSVITFVKVAVPAT